jgi:ribose 5-phosphate isomerase
MQHSVSCRAKKPIFINNAGQMIVIGDKTSYNGEKFTLPIEVIDF